MLDRKKNPDWRQIAEQGPTRRVLLSGQDQVFRRRLAAALRLRRLGVMESPRTLELLRRLALLARQGERPDLVLLDISDNPATGAVLREVLRIEAWDLPVILVTTAAEKQALVSLLQEGQVTCGNSAVGL
jgi:CheY-like chemotaxis protein